MNYKTDDSWFQIEKEDNFETVFCRRQTAETIAAEARNAARQPDTEGAWPDAEKLGYDRDKLAWSIFLAEYLAERKRIENTPHGWRFV